MELSCLQGWQLTVDSCVTQHWTDFRNCCSPLSLKNEGETGPGLYIPTLSFKSEGLVCSYMCWVVMIKACTVVTSCSQWPLTPSLISPHVLKLDLFKWGDFIFNNCPALLLKCISQVIELTAQSESKCDAWWFDLCVNREIKAVMDEATLRVLISRLAFSCSSSIIYINTDQAEEGEDKGLHG